MLRRTAVFLTTFVFIAAPALAIEPPTTKAKPVEATIKVDPNKKGSQTTQVIPGVSITIDTPESSQEDIVYNIVDHVFINANNAEITMGKRDETATFSISVVADDNTELVAEASSNGVIIPLNPQLAKVRKGQATSFSFTAIKPQEGEIRILNKNKVVVGRRAFKINKYKSVRQSLSIGGTSNINIIGGDFDQGPNGHINYSRSGDGWSQSYGVSGGPSGVSVNANASWNW